ncbi:hypothetical protein C772_01424 [Bhargavaea cecembensis DSE10]|uniref:Uncharacterized protein n=1 Tax=Bhargavaea cecembensis DSE10 TaxID=1235279 RepID=M7P7M9_9BACL|nr:hypothetical protein [Bhargavaea cecembensis]EMR06529.1 hypothetical protein C772_01424 [Bhargavaea cecembensis DSE10]
MKQKKLMVFLSMVLLFSSFILGTGNAEASTGAAQQDVTKPELSQETIELADPFIILKNNRFVVVDANSLIKVIGKDDFVKVKQELAEKNAVLSGVTSKEFEAAHVTGNTVEFINETSGFSTLASKGKNGISVHWWGYKVYLNDNLTNTTAQALAAGGGGAAIAAIWAPFISAPTAVVKAVAASAAIVLGGASAMFYKTNKGNGVYLRFTGIVPHAVIYTGMFAQ